MVPRQPWETAMGRDFAGRCGQWGVLGEGQLFWLQLQLWPLELIGVKSSMHPLDRLRQPRVYIPQEVPDYVSSTPLPVSAHLLSPPVHRVTGEEEHF